MVFVSRETPYMKLLKDFLARKHRLAVDSWGADDTAVRGVYDPLLKLITDNVKDESHLIMYPYPVWGPKERVTRIARNILLAEFLVTQWSEHFRGMDEAQLDEIAQSFKFENCLTRDGLNKVLTEHAQEVQKL